MFDARRYSHTMILMVPQYAKLMILVKAVGLDHSLVGVGDRISVVNGNRTALHIYKIQADLH